MKIKIQVRIFRGQFFGWYPLAEENTRDALLEGACFGWRSGARFIFVLNPPR